jgi:serine/threonine protein kinase
VNRKRFQQIKRIFEEAVDLDPETRVAFLEEACAGDSPLKEEILSLLAAHETDDGFLENSPPLDHLQASEPHPEVSLEGKQVGHYTILREIGRGGMGIVYLAEDSRLERKIALKALVPAFVGDEKREQRLRLEAKAAASLSHPTIATIYALEEIDGRLYMASEYVEGRSLRAELLAKPLPLRDLLETAIQIAQGLAAAHAKGIIHRDLKPENIIRDRQGNIKILDFGLVMLLPRSGSPKRRLTEAGTILGTPSYMSPEQLTGRTVDSRSDVFSFGILLYELASGVNPFEGKTPLSTIAKVMEAQPEPISQRSPEAAALDGIIGRCICRDPKARYSSARELALDLENLQSSLASGPVGRVKDEIERESASVSNLNAAWWVVHQTCVMAFYSLMVYLAWKVKERVTDWGLPIFLGVLVCAAVNGTWRTYLLFTAKFNRAALGQQIHKAALWTRRFDWAFTILLLAAALAISGYSHTMAGILTAAASGYLVVFLIVEPGTARQAVPPQDRR